MTPADHGYTQCPTCHVWWRLSHPAEFCAREAGVDPEVEHARKAHTPTPPPPKRKVEPVIDEAALWGGTS